MSRAEVNARALEAGRERAREEARRTLSNDGALPIGFDFARWTNPYAGGRYAPAFFRGFDAEVARLRSKMGTLYSPPGEDERVARLRRALEAAA